MRGCDYVDIDLAEMHAGIDRLIAAFKDGSILDLVLKLPAGRPGNADYFANMADDNRRADFNFNPRNAD